MITNVIIKILNSVFGLPLSLNIPPYIYGDTANGLHYFYLLGFKFSFESTLALIFTINLFIIAFCVYKKAHRKLK